MSLLQVGPDDYIAMKTLSDGRRLAIFKQDERVEHVPVCEVCVVDGRRWRIPHAGVVARLREHTGYVLVVSDNADEPLLWRGVMSDAQLAVVRDRYDNWTEGEDDRRREQTPEHPCRRATDGKGREL